ncbi:hypothetical protein AGLY_016377 [Aphis glycines]|uniref:CCHC-type domain-containing protein n=1 Tax=Aphis glycines TaxID=307491 RepID=A0A6G0SXT6_APHGL|nr:hypothetical protein AGLY_016377 [Aphis glycines]
MTTRKGTQYGGLDESEDSNLGTSVATNDTGETTNTDDTTFTGGNDSDLIDLNQTFYTTELPEETEMANKLNFRDAMKAIPSFGGGSESLLTSYFNRCEFVLEYVDEKIKPMILDAIVSQLTDKASDAVRYREITSWEELKAHLTTIFGKTHSVQFLQKQFNQIKQYEKESIQQYADRVEKISHELTTALTLNKTTAEAKIISETIQTQTLAIFIAGIQYDIRLILKATKVPTFEEAVFLAVEKDKLNEKIEYKTDNRNKYVKKANDKSKIQCHRCSKYGHYSNECRTIEHKITSFKNQTENNFKKSANQVKVCHYCKKENHVISKCRKRIYNDKKKKEQGEASTSKTNNYSLETPKKKIKFDHDQFRKTVESVVRIFRDKNPQLMYVTLAQLYDSMHATNNTLNADYINTYDNRNKTKPIFVTWNGETDKKILNNPNLEHILLNITTYDVHLDNNYVICLIDERDKTSVGLVYQRPVDQICCFMFTSIWDALTTNKNNNIYKSFKHLSSIMILFILTIFYVGVNTQRFTDDKLSQQSDIYYKNRGPIKIVTTTWELTAYVNITTYEQRWGKIDQFINDTEVLKLKPDIVDKISKTARLLFGLCNADCMNKFNTIINRFTGTNDNQIKLIEEQIKIIRLNQDQEDLKIKKVEITSDDLKNKTIDQFMKNYLSIHFSFANLVLTKYIYETNTLLETIQMARVGQMHPSLLPPNDLLEQLRDIKVSLPSGTELPIELDLVNAYELLRLSDLTVYCSDNRIVFIITLPLVYQNELTLYHLIPKPVCKLTNCLYIKPSYNFLAISKTKELYTTYDQFHYSACKSAHNFLLCPEINPLHPKSTRPICEIQLLQDPVKVPKSCEIRQIQINTTIFHKHEFQNAWLYASSGETIFVTCDSDKESSSHTIEGVVIVRLNSTCKGYATRDVLIPGKVNREPYPDFIPNSVLKPSMKVTNLAIMETKNIINNKMDDLNAVSNTHNYLQFLDNNISDLEKLRQKITIYEYVLVITISIGGCRILIFIINIMTHFLQQYRTRRSRNRCTSVVFRNEQNVSAIPSSQPHLAMEQYKDELGEQSVPLYPKMKSFILNMQKSIIGLRTRKHEIETYSRISVYHDTYVYFGDYAQIV